MAERKQKLSREGNKAPIKNLTLIVLFLFRFCKNKAEKYNLNLVFSKG